ncbi:Protein CbbY [Ruegeria sp. THAF57]|uniref:HAD-IA family hydrolase n=1 Tax=Ruegeria sp. THAF57 TaxID=2744555 RepID=UPI0015DDED61|nr:HAD-IA family hydrolase [Ruegeria sp. THAF57]CAD0186814.1 Protein CbbY [Ruegeria sp. THAF57]
MTLRALIFDVDGTLAETEVVHRIAYNIAFAEAGLDWYWTKDAFIKILRNAGAKEQMRAYAKQVGTPLSEKEIISLHDCKMYTYRELLKESGRLQLREGVRDLISRARHKGLKIGIATASHRMNVESLCQACWGKSADRIFNVVATGEEVQAKKPSPDVYQLALNRLAVHPDEAIAIEDSQNGLRAGLDAGLRVLVTPSDFTRADDFSNATWVRDNLALDTLPNALFEALKDEATPALAQMAR